MLYMAKTLILSVAAVTAVVMLPISVVYGYFRYHSKILEQMHIAAQLKIKIATITSNPSSKDIFKSTLKSSVIPVSMIILGGLTIASRVSDASSVTPPDVVWCSLGSVLFISGLLVGVADSGRRTLTSHEQFIIRLLSELISKESDTTTPNQPEQNTQPKKMKRTKR